MLLNNLGGDVCRYRVCYLYSLLNRVFAKRIKLYVTWLVHFDNIYYLSIDRAGNILQSFTSISIFKHYNNIRSQLFLSCG